MLRKDEARELKNKIRAYVEAEMNVGSAKSIAAMGMARDNAIKHAVAEASAKLEEVFTYIDKELS